jgi:acyl dehydratase
MSPDWQLGQQFTRVLVTALTRTQIVQYAGASGDFNPLHTDEPYAQRAGFPTVFAHGMLTMGLTARLLTDLVGDDRLISYGGRFRTQVWPGDTLTATVTVRAVTEASSGGVLSLSVETRNQSDRVVFTGSAEAAIGPVLVR